MNRTSLRNFALASTSISFTLFWPALALAQNNDEEAAIVFAIVILVAVVIGLVIGLAIMAVVCYLVSEALKVVPEQYRTVQPGQVWLLLIPCFSLIWNFFVYPKVSESYENYFQATGRGGQFGDCSKQLATWYCITAVMTLIPYLGSIAGIASLVILVIYIVKLLEYKRAAIETQSGKPFA